MHDPHLDVNESTYAVADFVSIDGKISHIGPDAEAPSGVREVDGTGKFVIPGLIDCHATPGADAGMLVLSADPLADIAVLADIADHLDVLIRNGKVVSP